MGIKGRLARHSNKTRKAVEQYFKELVPNNEGFKTYTINHIRTYIKNTTNIHPDPKTVRNILNALNIENIKRIKRKKEYYSKATLNAVKDYFNTLAPDENGIKPYVMKNVLKHVIKIAKTESSYSTIENIISTLELKNIKRIPKSPNIPNQWLPHLNKTTDAIRTYINQLPKNKIGFKIYTIPQIRTYLKETLNIKSTPDTIRKIISSLDDIKCGTITSQWPEYLNKIENAMRTYFNQLPENENGIKIYAVQHITELLKKDMNISMGNYTVKKIIEDIGFKNIKNKRTDMAKTLTPIVQQYFTDLVPNRDGIKLYKTKSITSYINNHFNIKPSKATISKTIKSLNLINIKLINPEKPQNLHPQYLKKITDAVQTYFNQLPKNENGIKIYSILQVRTYLKETISDKSSPAIIKKIINNLKLENIQIIKKRKVSKEEREHAVQQYFNEIKPDSNGIKNYIVRHILFYVKDKVNISLRYSEILNIINNLNLQNIQRIEMVAIYRSIVTSYFNKIEPDADGIKRYALPQIYSYIQNYTPLTPSPKTITKVINKLNLKNIQPT